MIRMTDKRELLVEMKTGVRRPAAPGRMLLSSAPAAWNGFHLEQHYSSGFENNDVFTLNHVITLRLDSPVTLEAKRNGKFQQVRVMPGQINIYPAHVPCSVRTSDAGQFVLVSLDKQFVARAAHESGALDDYELVPAMGADDDLVRSLVLGLKSEAENGRDGSRVYAEALATTLAVHLIEKHSTRVSRERENSSGLARFQLRRVSEFIHEHLAEEIPLGKLADLAGISAFHFARMFKKSTGLAPHQYLIRCRVKRAKELLLAPNASIADVAAQVGFCDQSHLAVHFKRVFGLTPKGFSRGTAYQRNLS